MQNDPFLLGFLLDSSTVSCVIEDTETCRPLNTVAHCLAEHLPIFGLP